LEVTLSGVDTGKNPNCYTAGGGAPGGNYRGWMTDGGGVDGTYTLTQTSDCFYTYSPGTVARLRMWNAFPSSCFTGGGSVLIPIDIIEVALDPTTLAVTRVEVGRDTVGFGNVGQAFNYSGSAALGASISNGNGAYNVAIYSNTGTAVVDYP
jgi:hypothetical protein